MKKSASSVDCTNNKNFINLWAEKNQAESLWQKVGLSSDVSSWTEGWRSQLFAVSDQEDCCPRVTVRGGGGSGNQAAMLQNHSSRSNK